MNLTGAIGLRGGAGGKVAKLKKSMMDGKMVEVLRASIDRVEAKRANFLFPMDLALPCILHLENRVSEKLVVMVMLEGLRHRKTGVASKEYFGEVEGKLNNGILSEENGNWVLPTEGDELKKISLSNVTARKFVNAIDQLFDIVFKFHEDDGLRRGVFQRCVDGYPKMMEKIRQRRDFTDEEIVSLQKDIDVWYADWVSVTGREGITNYVHMLGAGHLAYYLKKFRNLYRFSNQSWERLNKRVKKMYLQKTQRGGHGKYISAAHMVVDQCPHTKPLAKWLQRVMMWNTGKGEQFFLSLENKD